MPCAHAYRTVREDPRPKRRDPLRLVVFDMDGVLIQGHSSWVLVHQYFGVDNKAGYDRYMAGEMNDMEFIRSDVKLWQDDGPVHEAEVNGALGEPNLMRGAQETVSSLHNAGIDTAIVSGGLDYLATKVAKELGIRNVFANGLETDQGGYLTGEGILRTPIHDKSVPMRALMDQWDIEPAYVAAIGDSCPDQSMFESAGVAVAFQPKDECLAEVADHVVKERNLKSILQYLI